MKFALINPRWTNDEGMHFGCSETHLPIEFGYTRALLEERGHDVLLVNAPADQLSNAEIVGQIESFQTEIAVITTANSYLSWQCPPPDLKIPIVLSEDLRHVVNFIIAVGPHGSSTPRAVLNKLNIDAVVLGECEEVLPMFPDSIKDLRFLPSIAYRSDGEIRIQGTLHSSNMTLLPVVKWQNSEVQTHTHHHQRYGAVPACPGAEMEVSRGCKYHCTVCEKDNYRKRPIEKIVAELDRFLDQGVGYIYFIDEIFLPDKKLLETFAQRSFRFGIQTRIDLWSEELLTMLGNAGCVSLEAGVESMLAEGPSTAKLIFASQHLPFVKAKSLGSKTNEPLLEKEWRHLLISSGIPVDEPVPLFPYPGSPAYTRLWGVPDDYAWMRAQNYYLQLLDQGTDITNESVGRASLPAR